MKQSEKSKESLARNQARYTSRITGSYAEIRNLCKFRTEGKEMSGIDPMLVHIPAVIIAVVLVAVAFWWRYRNSIPAKQRVREKQRVKK